MQIKIKPKNLQKLFKEKGSWKLETTDGSRYSGELNMQEIKAEVNNNQVLLSVEDIKSIERE
jgi:hypothetical protein